MVATVVGLRLRSMRHLLARERWRQIVVVAAGVWVLALVPGVLWGRAALAGADPEARHTALVVLAAIIGVGWILVPLLVAGGDDTLEPRRFATFGVDARTIMPGLALSAFLTIPAAFFVLLQLVLLSSWGAAGWQVMAVATVAALVQVATYVFGARLAAAWAARVFATRRARAFALVASLGGVIVFVYLAWRALGRGLERLFEADFTALVDAVAATPLVSAVTAPTSAAAGDWAGAAWRLGIAVVWALLLVLAWRETVAHSLVHPAYRSGAGRSGRDAVALAGRAVPHLGHGDRTGPAGAVHARLTRAWRTDPRYLSGLAALLVMPALFIALVIPAFDLDPRWSYATPLVLAATIGWGRHNDVAYDSSAVWLDIVSGRLGGAIMRGRFAAVVTWAVPLVTVAVVGVSAWTRAWWFALPLLGASLGVLGATLGVAAVTSVALPYRTPASGENPFAAEVGSVGAGFVAQLASSAASVVVVPIAIVPCVLALAVAPAWGVVSAVGGTAIGVAGYVAGVRVAGRIYDARAGALVGAVR